MKNSFSTQIITFSSLNHEFCLSEWDHDRFHVEFHSIQTLFWSLIAPDHRGSPQYLSWSDCWEPSNSKIRPTDSKLVPPISRNSMKSTSMSISYVPRSDIVLSKLRISPNDSEHQVIFTFPRYLLMRNTLLRFFYFKNKFSTTLKISLSQFWNPYGPRATQVSFGSVRKCHVPHFYSDTVTFVAQFDQIIISWTFSLNFPKNYPPYNDNRDLWSENTVLVMFYLALKV